MTPTAILRVKVTPVSAKGGVRRAAGGFLRYVQHRDHHYDDEQVKDVEGFVRYVAHRDAAASDHRLFDAEGDAGTAERRALTDYVARSTQGLGPSWRQGRDGTMRDQQLAIYRFVLSPADARGLDLRRLTRNTMADLDKRAGSRGAPTWIAAEHRNTEHPHVHIVMAARRETSDSRTRAFRLTKDRLAAMKEAMSHDIALQRQERQQAMERMDRTLGRAGNVESRMPRDSPVIDLLHVGDRVNMSGPKRAPARDARARTSTRLNPGLSRLLVGLARGYRIEAEREALKRLRAHDDDERGMERGRSR